MAGDRLNGKTAEAAAERPARRPDAARGGLPPSGGAGSSGSFLRDAASEGFCSGEKGEVGTLLGHTLTDSTATATAAVDGTGRDGRPCTGRKGDWLGRAGAGPGRAGPGRHGRETPRPLLSAQPAPAHPAPPAPSLFSFSSSLFFPRLASLLSLSLLLLLSSSLLPFAKTEGGGKQPVRPGTTPLLLSSSPPLLLLTGREEATAAPLSWIPRTSHV